MGKVSGFLRGVLVLAAVLTTGVLGFLGIKRGLRTPPEISSVNKFTKLFRSPAGVAITLVIVAGIAAGVFVLVKKATTPPKPPAAATVNGEDILDSDFQTRLAAQTYFYTTISPLPEEELPGLKERVRENMIQELLLTQFLAENGITVTDEEVRQRIQEIAVDRMYEGDWAKYEEELKTIYRTTLEEVMRTYRLDILKEKTSQLKTQKRVSAIWIDKDELQFVSYESMDEKERTKHEEANRSKKEKAEEALRRIQSGEDFAKIAGELSEDEESKKNGGNLGFLFLDTYMNPGAQPTLDSFPGKTPIFSALDELGNGENKMYEIFTGYAMIKIAEIKEGPRGTQNFDDWYVSFRSRANITIP